LADPPATAITAAIVGVVLNLAVWFGLHVFFPSGQGIDWFAIGLCAVTFVAILRYKVDIIPVVMGAGLLGLAYKFLRGFG
jgi:chromate transporter